MTNPAASTATFYAPEHRQTVRCKRVHAKHLRVTDGIRVMVDALVEDGWDVVTAAATVTILVRTYRACSGDPCKWTLDTPSRVRAYREDPASWIRDQVHTNGSVILSVMGETWEAHDENRRAEIDENARAFMKRA